MALPWYVTGAARPESAKFKGSAKRDQQMRDFVAKLKSTPAPAPAPRPVVVQQQAPTLPVWQAPAPAPVAAPAAVVQPAPQVTYAPLPQPQPVYPQATPVAVTTPQQGYQPPVDPLGFLPGGSEAVWGGGFSPRRVWDWGAENLKIDLSTPGTNQRGEERAEEEARQAAIGRREREDWLNDLLEKKWNREVDLETVKESRTKRAQRSKDRDETAQAMTLEQWNALTPEQQASVELNAQFDQARQRDREIQNAKPSIEQRLEYLGDYQQVFGEAQDVEDLTYAPETVGLLKQLNVQEANNPYTLDDFLQGDAMTTRRQTMNLGQELPEARRIGPTEFEPAELNRRQQRLKFAQQIAAAQVQLQSDAVEEQLAVGRRLLSGTTYESANEIAQTYGAEPIATAAERYDKINDDDKELIELYVEALAVDSGKPNDLTESLSAVQGDMVQRGKTPEEQAEIYRSMLDRVELAMTNAVTWYPQNREAGDTLRNPQAVATALGRASLKPEQQ